MNQKVVKLEIKNRLHYFIEIESVLGVKRDVLLHFKIKNFDLENIFLKILDVKTALSPG